MEDCVENVNETETENENERSGQSARNVVNFGVEVG